MRIWTTGLVAVLLAGLCTEAWGSGCEAYLKAKQTYEDTNNAPGASEFADFLTWEKLAERTAKAASNVLKEFKKNPRCEPSKSLKYMQIEAAARTVGDRACAVFSILISGMGQSSEEERRFFGRLCSMNPNRQSCKDTAGYLHSPKYTLVCGQENVDIRVDKPKLPPNFKALSDGRSACAFLVVASGGSNTNPAFSDDKLQQYVVRCSNSPDVEDCLLSVKVIGEEFRLEHFPDLKCGQKADPSLDKQSEKVVLHAESGDEETVAPQPDLSVAPIASRLGLTLSDLTPEARTKYGITEDLTGVVVTDVTGGSVAAERNIEAGNVITEVDQEKVASTGEVQTALDKAKMAKRRNILLVIAKSDGELYFVAVDISR